MNDQTPWSQAMSLAKYGKWGLGLVALNYYGWLIDLAAALAAGLVLVAVIADRIRTRRLLRQWNDHCQDIADQRVARQRATVTTAPEHEHEHEQWRAAA